MTGYAEFLARKQPTGQSAGRSISTADIHPLLHDWQARLVAWAVETGRLLRDGTLVNRFRQQPGWPAHRIKAADEWIANHGETCRKAHADMLDGAVS